jgi:L-ascorbate metabolism protein UlaG (beta-lactamase superfamily)
MNRIKWSGLFICLWLVVSSGSAVKVQWLGQSAFYITSKSGIHILTDPYKYHAFNGALQYGAITTPADIITISHNHDDHNGWEGILGNPVVIRTTGTFTVQNIIFSGITVFHDKEQGANRGVNFVYSFTVDHVRFCHLGDLGHQLTRAQARDITQGGPIDVLFIPAGGKYTLDPTETESVINILKPRLVIPMHYKTAKTNLPLQPIDNFLKDKKNIITRFTSTIEVTDKSLPRELQITVLQPAL